MCTAIAESLTPCVAQMADFMGAKKHVTKELCGIFTDVLRSIRHANVKDITGVELCSDEKFKCMVSSNTAYTQLSSFFGVLAVTNSNHVRS